MHIKKPNLDAEEIKPIYCQTLWPHLCTLLYTNKTAKYGPVHFYEWLISGLVRCVQDSIKLSDC